MHRGCFNIFSDWENWEIITGQKTILNMNLKKEKDFHQFLNVHYINVFCVNSLIKSFAIIGTYIVSLKKYMINEKVFVNFDFENGD